MPSVHSLRTIFEPSSAALTPVSRPQRVQLKRYSMPRRQSTLSFNGTGSPAVPVKRHSMAAASSRTPPAEESEGDTIVVNTSGPQTRMHMSLPTPSESATDASSQASGTLGVNSPPRSRSKRVSRARRSASRETLVASCKEDHVDEEVVRSIVNEKQRNISGDTLVADADVDASVSQTTLLKEGINALDMTWNMSVHFEGKEEDGDGEEQTENESTGTTTAPELSDEKISHQKRVKKVEKQNKWDARRKSAEKNATRRSSRATMLLDKATEVVSVVTSTVLGKRKNIAEQARNSTPQGDIEPEPKKARFSTSISSIPAQSNTSTSKPNRARAPKDKKWLTTGLYAGQKRTFNPSLSESKNKRKSTTISTSTTSQPTTISTVEKENHTLPLPMFAGTRLLESGRDFKLPFDIFSPLPPGAPKPDEWRKTNKNVFIGDAADLWRSNNTLFAEHSTCNCKPATGCDSDCMNRYMYYECDGNNCRLSAELCGNRAFAGLKERVKRDGNKQFNVGVEVVRTADRGYGVRASRCFDADQVIVEYTGEVLTQEECERRMHTDYKDNECYYLMAFDQNMIIDATRGSLARFINHSCAPNCRMEKWTVSGKPRMALFANSERGVMTGEELTYDYNFDPYSQKNVQVCRCGSENCRGVLGPKPKDLPGEKMLAGAKRKIAEVLGLNEDEDKESKRVKKAEKPRLPRGWTYVEPNAKTPGQILEEERMNADDALKRRPSKLKRMFSGKSSKSVKTVNSRASIGAKRRGGQRVVSTSSEKALISHEEDVTASDEDRSATGASAGAVASLKVKAETFKKSVGRSLRAGR